MAYEMKEGSGKLFKNEKKEKKEDRDYQGSIMINGKEHWFSGWINQGKNGKYLSVSIGKEKERSNFTPKGNDEMPKNTIVDDDLGDVPF
jgi:hypothetical protein